MAFILQLAVWSSTGEKDGHYGARGRNLAAGVSENCIFLKSLLLKLFSFYYQVFGLFNTIAYAASTYFLYLEHKSGQAQ